jgi:hypothetical protein
MQASTRFTVKHITQRSVTRSSVLHVVSYLDYTDHMVKLISQRRILVVWGMKQLKVAFSSCSECTS